MKAAFAIWYRLPDLPFRMLTYMANRSIDADDPPIYCAGWEELAHAGGRDVPAEIVGDKDNAKSRRAALVSVTSSVKTLVDKGAVKVYVRGAPGRNAHYALTFNAASVQAEPEPNDAGSPCIVEDDDQSNGSGSADNGAGSACLTVQGEPAPEEQRGVLEEKTSSMENLVDVDRATAAAARMVQKYKQINDNLAYAAVAAIITERPDTRNPAGLAKHLGDAGELDEWIEKGSALLSPPPPKPKRETIPWCGDCDPEIRQVELPSGRWTFCPTCSPRRTESKAPPRPTQPTANVDPGTACAQLAARLDQEY